jgi:hypothetical protein
VVENLLYTEEGLFREIANRAKADGVSSREEWDDVAEEVIEERRRVGELDDDEDLENLEDTLKQRYAEYERSLRIE